FHSGAMRKEEQDTPRIHENSLKGGVAASVATPTTASTMPVEDDDEDEEEAEEEDEEEDAEEEEEEDGVEEGGIAVEGGMTTQEEVGSVLAGGEGGGGSGMAGYWRQSRPSSPRMPPPEQSEQSSRPKSRHELQAARYNNLGYWRARRVTFYKNGDPYFPGVEFRFKPGRDIGSLEALLDRLSLRMDLPRGARHIFSMDGDRKINLDELEDGASYVVSSYKTFKVRKIFDPSHEFDYCRKNKLKKNVLSNSYVYRILKIKLNQRNLRSIYNSLS
ncbi:hypothetical protein ALC60_08510, partial [Trachymyrmex zeteki]